jgi:hypothetical protein
MKEIINGDDDTTSDQDHIDAIGTGGIGPGAGHAAQAGGRPISPAGGSANESFVCDL